jgi:hypothetical protein
MSRFDPRAAMSAYGTFHKKGVPASPFVALSLRQPWAWAVLHLGKVIENRKWCTDYRGPLLIHASATMKLDEDYDACAQACDDVFGIGHYLPNAQDIARGGFVGRARLTGVVGKRPSRLPISGNFLDHYPPSLREPRLVVSPLAPHRLSVAPWRWHFQEQYGFILEDIEPMPFVPSKGALGLYPVQADPWATAQETRP